VLLTILTDALKSKCVRIRFLTQLKLKKKNMTQLNSKKVLEKIRKLRNRVKDVEVGVQDLTSLQEEMLMLFEIIYSKKTDYKSIENYIPPPKVLVILPARGKPVECIEIPSKEEIKERNKIFIENALTVLNQAKKKYLLKNELEKKNEEFTKVDRLKKKLIV